MSGADRHPGDRLAALVDGRLTEPERSRLLSHLAGCPSCRNDYDAQLTMKGLLRGLDEPGAPVDLRARLRGLPSSPPPPLPPGQRRLSRSRRAVGGVGPGRSPRSRRHRLVRAGAGAMTFTVIALAGAYALGGAPSGEAVSPPVDRYVREHAAVSGGLPFTEPVLWQLPARSGAAVQPGSPVPPRLNPVTGVRVVPVGAARGAP